MHAQNCAMVGSNASAQAMTHQHEPLKVLADAHDSHQHHHQASENAEIVFDSGAINPIETSNSSAMDCDHCDDCHDHCGAMLISSLSSARHGNLHDLTVQTGLILIHSYHERISRPPRA